MAFMYTEHISILIFLEAFWTNEDTLLFFPHGKVTQIYECMHTHTDTHSNDC